MNPRQLSHLIALAEEGRFARAAERVHLSHAAFSRSIQALERQLGVRLFDRGPKGARATAAGEAVLLRARQVDFVNRCFQHDVALLRAGEIGELSLGVGPIPAAVVVPDLLIGLRRASPDVVIRVRNGNTASLLDLLHAEAVDFFMADPRLMQADPRLQTQPLARIHGGLYCRSGHALKRKAAASRASIQQYGIGMVSASPALRTEVATSLGYGIAEPLPVTIECDDLNALVQLATESDLLAMIPHHLAQQAGRSLHRITIQGAKRSIFADVHAVWLRGRSLSPAAVRAIEMAKTIAQKCSGAPG
jgi:DNA-binding transcriptional LysR family regulator